MTLPQLQPTIIPVRADETADALMDVARERFRQIAKWGAQTWPDGTGCVSYRNARDAAQRHTDDQAAAGRVTWTDILLEEVYEALAETHPDKLREELIQVAAVALSWVE